MKDYFTSETPTNYTNEDNMKHYQFKDYKHLKNVDWEDEKPSSLTFIGGIAFIVVLYGLLFLATI